MSNFIQHTIVTLILFAIGISCSAQHFASMRLNTNEVYKQQPIKATVTIYTSTWFTDSPDLGVIHVPNSFVLPFKRTLSSIQYVNNKKYATLEFYYLIFPFENGEITIPELQISISTPSEGGYKGVKRNLKTKAITFKVKDEPEKFKGDQWLVAKDAVISEKWNKPLNEAKVGEVIERTITIRAVGTLPAFIPKSIISENDWASIYPREPKLRDTRTNNDANGIRTENYRYLLEKEGTFNIEPITIAWWNPYLNKQYSRSTKELSITIHPNPDLGILTTMRDSLKTQVSAFEPSQKKPFTVLGLTLKELLFSILFLVISFWLIIKSIKLIIKVRQEQKQRYLKSDQYLFDKLLQTHNQSSKQQLNALYVWLIGRKNKTYTIEDLNSTSASDLLNQSFSTGNIHKMTKQEIKLLQRMKKDEEKQNKLFPPTNP